MTGKILHTHWLTCQRGKLLHANKGKCCCCFSKIFCSMNASSFLYVLKKTSIFFLFQNRNEIKNGAILRLTTSPVSYHSVPLSLQSKDLISIISVNYFMYFQALDTLYPLHRMVIVSLDDSCLWFFLIEWAGVVSVSEIL